MKKTRNSKHVNQAVLPLLLPLGCGSLEGFVLRQYRDQVDAYKRFYGNDMWKKKLDKARGSKTP